MPRALAHGEPNPNLIRGQTGKVSQIGGGGRQSFEIVIVVSCNKILK